MAKTMRERCQEMIDKIKTDGMLRQGSAVEDLMAFVESEKGRAAHNSLADTLPLVLYFANEVDRAEFLAVVHMAKPGMVAKKMP